MTGLAHRLGPAHLAARAAGVLGLTLAAVALSTLGAPAGVIAVALVAGLWGAVLPDSSIPTVAMLMVGLGGLFGSPPTTALEWSVIVAAASALLISHAGYTCAASWPMGASVSATVARRWLRDIGLVVASTCVVALGAVLLSDVTLPRSRLVFVLGVLLPGLVGLTAAVAAARPTAQPDDQTPSAPMGNGD